METFKGGLANALTVLIVFVIVVAVVVLLAGNYLFSSLRNYNISNSLLPNGISGNILPTFRNNNAINTTTVPLTVQSSSSVSSTTTVNSTFSNSSFPFPCGNPSFLSLHLHPWLKIEINGQFVTIPAAIGIGKPVFNSTTGTAFVGSCFEPLHTHDTSGIIHLESPNNVNYTLSNFFAVWNATYGSVMINGTAHPVVFGGNNILGFRTDATHKIMLLVDGKASNASSSLVLNQLNYCNVTNGRAYPCSITANENPYYMNQTYPYGAGHTIVIVYNTS